MDHTDEYNDRNGTSNDNTSDGMAHVGPLSQLDDFQVADGYPDPRGWDVVGADASTSLTIT